MKNRVLLACSLFLFCVSSAFAAETLKIGVENDELTDLFSNKQTSLFSYDFVAIDSEEEALGVIKEGTLDAVLSTVPYSKSEGVEYASLGGDIGMYWKTGSAQDANIRLLYASLCAIPSTKCPVEN